MLQADHQMVGSLTNFPDKNHKTDNVELPAYYRWQQNYEYKYFPQI